MKKLFAIGLISFFPMLAQAECDAGFQTFLSCEIRGKNTELSVCFRDDEVQYNYGKIGLAPDLSLSQHILTIDYEKEFGIGYREHGYPNFRNGEYLYKVYAGVSSPENANYGTIRVLKKGEEISLLACDDKSVIHNIEAFNAVYDIHLAQWQQKIDYWGDKTIVSTLGDLSEPAPFSCPYHEKRPINFTSNVVEDLLDIQIVGDNCDTALVELRAETASGNVVHSSSARALDYTYELEGPEGVRDMLMELMGNGPYTGTDIPNDAKLAEGAYHVIDQALLDQTRKEDLPVFCHIAGKTYSNCFVYANGKSSLIFTYGS